MPEDSIMKDENVTITKTLAVVNGVSYPTNTISAISVRANPVSKWWLIGAIVFGLGGTMGLAHGDIGAGVVGFAIVAACIYFRPKQTFSLMVRSAGADTSVLTSRDADYLGRVKGAIEEAVRLRG